jgi:hypothetical protein
MRGARRSARAWLGYPPGTLPRLPQRLERPATLRLQGGYYLATGVWALVHRRSFEAVSGRKTDYWLVRTVAGLTAGVGAALVVAARGDDVGADVYVLAATTAATFAAVDGYYVEQRRISKVYLADLVLQCGFLATLAGQRGRAASRPPGG